MNGVTFFLKVVSEVYKQTHCSYLKNKSKSCKGVWQKDELGGRGRALGGARQDLSKSKLRWGVGKLIAHASVRPRVVPFAHV